MYIAWLVLSVLMRFLVVISAQTLRCEPENQSLRIMDCLKAREKLIATLIRLSPYNPWNNPTHVLFGLAHPVTGIPARHMDCLLVVTVSAARERQITLSRVVEGLDRVILECVFQRNAPGVLFQPDINFYAFYSLHQI